MSASRHIAFILALIVSGASLAGSGTAKLTCRSASGRTLFTADLQDIVGLFEGGKLTIDGTSIDFPAAGTCDTGDVVWKPELGLFTLTFSHGTPDGPVWFRFWAIPSSFKTISKDRGSEQGAIYEFDGVIEASEPRADKGCCTPDITLSCRLVYRI